MNKYKSVTKAGNPARENKCNKKNSIDKALK